MCDYINRRDSRFDDDDLPGWLMGTRDIARQQRARLADIFAGLGPQCIGLVEGNHEYDILAHSDVDAYRSFAEAIGAGDVCVGPSGFANLSFRRAKGHSWPWTLYMAHGSGGGRSEGASITQLANMAAHVRADAYVMGHTHQPVARPVEVLQVSARGTPESARQWWINCGSYLAGGGDDIMPAYAERRGYRPTPIITYKLIVQPDKHSVRVEEL
jgi:hypothetical protein